MSLFANLGGQPGLAGGQPPHVTMRSIMNTCRLTLLVAAVATSVALAARYCAQVAVGFDFVPLPVTMLLWLAVLMTWQGFIAAQCCAALNTHADRRMLQIIATIRAVDADGEEGEQARKTIDAHLAAMQDIGTPTSRRSNGYLGLVR